MKERINAFFGKDTEFEGNLSFSGSVRIEGTFKGEIRSEGVLILGRSALVESDIRASHVIISGEVRGNVVADEKIEIYSPASVTGYLETPLLTVEEGVLFEGKCHMISSSEKEEKRLSLISGKVK